MKKLLIPIVVAFLFFGCEREPVDLPTVDLRTECQKQNIGYITLSNGYKDAYDVFVNSVYYKQVPANSHIDNIKYAAGKSYTIKIQQVSGYILYPTVKQFTLTLNQCDNKGVDFTN